MSCISMDCEKQIVLRTRRLMRVCNVRCFRSICCVFRLPGLCSAQFPAVCKRSKVMSMGKGIEEARVLAGDEPCHGEETGVHRVDIEVGQQPRHVLLGLGVIATVERAE